MDLHPNVPIHRDPTFRISGHFHATAHGKSSGNDATTRAKRRYNTLRAGSPAKVGLYGHKGKEWNRTNLAKHYALSRPMAYRQASARSMGGKSQVKSKPVPAKVHRKWRRRQSAAQIEAFSLPCTAPWEKISHEETLVRGKGRSPKAKAALVRKTVTIGSAGYQNVLGKTNVLAPWAKKLTRSKSARSGKSNSVSGTAPTWFKVDHALETTAAPTTNEEQMWCTTVADNLHEDGSRKGPQSYEQYGVEDTSVNMDSPAWFHLNHVHRASRRGRTELWHHDCADSRPKPKKNRVSSTAPGSFRLSAVELEQQLDHHTPRETVWTLPYDAEAAADEMDSAVSKLAPPWFHLPGVRVIEKGASVANLVVADKMDKERTKKQRPCTARKSSKHRGDSSSRRGGGARVQWARVPDTGRSGSRPSTARSSAVGSGGGGGGNRDAVIAGLRHEIAKTRSRVMQKLQSDLHAARSRNAHLLAKAESRSTGRLSTDRTTARREDF